jgi:hypothetical protein
MAFLEQSGARAFEYICRRHSPSVYSIIWEGWFTGTVSGCSGLENEWILAFAWVGEPIMTSTISLSLI